MKEIDVAHVDKLNELISEMEVINYINDLLQGDTIDNMRIGLSWTQQSAYFFMLERYKDIVARMREYVNSDS